MTLGYGVVKVFLPEFYRKEDEALIEFQNRPGFVCKQVKGMALPPRNKALESRFRFKSKAKAIASRRVWGCPSLICFTSRRPGF